MDKTYEPHPVDLHVGGAVRALRAARGYSQSDLGRALGLTFQQVQKYERGTNRISASKLWEAAHFLKVSITAFFPAPEDPLSRPAASLFISPRAADIAHVVEQLSPTQQKLILSLAREMTKARDLVATE